MAAALFGKKEPGDVDASQTSGASASELEQLTGQLGRLGELLAQANEQIAGYLVRRESQATAGGAGGATSGALEQQIAALAEKVDRLASAGGVAAPVPGDHALGAVLGPLQEKLDRVEAGVKALCETSVPGTGGDAATNAPILDAVRQLQAQLDAGLQRLTELVTPQEETTDDATQAASSAHWEWAILGSDLAQQPALAFQRQQLLNGVLEGDPGACALAGQLLVFQSAPPERLPQLLKDIGEAFYRWQPKTSPGTNPVEESLVRWLQRTCETAGIYNTIVLVHPGERFDSTRHTATSRGVEITEVHGWIVLRDNGKVYTKAAVAVH